MSEDLLQKLKEWRKDTAQKEKVEFFRVLPNNVIEDIARLKPQTKEELLGIKGIREKKFAKYGQDILVLINDKEDRIGLKAVIQDDKEQSESNTYSVSNYLNLLNDQLQFQKGRVQGEISSLKIQETYLFFSLKDKKDESVLNCFMWVRDYRSCSIDLETGMEVIIEGFPEIYKPGGHLNLKVSTVELVGEGVLKKAYDKLKKKFELEGLFAEERKKSLPDFPQKIGLITSKTGAVIHDFSTNLGQYGYQVKFVNSRVEGQTAVHDLISAINYFENKDIDVLVIIRGGGSLESLQAFNNEVLVRKLISLKMPVICGIGHEKDVPLASLVADLMVSTPTAVTVVLNKSWDKALNRIQIFERDLIYKYQETLSVEKHRLDTITGDLKEKSTFVFKKFELLRVELNNKLVNLGHILKDANVALNNFAKLLITNFKRNFNQFDDSLNNTEKRLKTVNPLRQLKLGYSIARIKGVVVRSTKQVNHGEKLDIQVADGKIESQVNNIINNK